MTDRRQKDGGYTLVEALVVMMIFGIVIAIVMGIVIEVSYGAADNMTRVSQVRNAELALAQIDRQVRSGNVISDPNEESDTASGVPAGDSLRVFTQTDGVHQCVQWRVKYADDDERGVLEYRSWDPQWETVGGNVDDWSVVARDIVANDEHQAFHKKDTGQSETSSVQITVFVQGERTQSKPTAVSTTLTGRNTIYGYPVDSCDNVPAP